MPIEDAYELAYREAVRALEHQRAALAELRSRASLLLAAASVTVSLPGPLTSDADRVFALLAIAAFVLLSVCLVRIIWPHGDWHFDTNPHDLVAKHLQSEEATGSGLRLDLIAHMARDQRVNGVHLERIARTFRTGACLLVIQILSAVAAASGLL